jgi:hypothetical protein
MQLEERQKDVLILFSQNGFTDVRDEGAYASSATPLSPPFLVQTRSALLVGDMAHNSWRRRSAVYLDEDQLT